MKLRFEQLSQHLAQQLAPIYAISGEEYCLVEETVMAIRQKAMAMGYAERETVTVESHFNWNQLLNNLQSLSLFSSQKIVEIHLPSGKPGDAGSQFFQQYVSQLNTDIIVILILPKIESASTKSKWWQAIERAGVTLQIWPLDSQGVKRWLTQQLQQVQLKMEPAAIELLLTQTQGNLLATRQEVQKLGLLFAAGTTINHAQLCEILQDQADFNVFDLVDSCNIGDAKAALRILHKLQASGVEPILILWALARELRQLHSMRLNVQGGMTIAAALQQQWLPLPRKHAVEKALSRFKIEIGEQLLIQAANIDAMIKGSIQQSAWPAISDLCLSYCGEKL